MKSTSDIMVKSAGTKWKQIEAHVDRTQPYYSNQNIDLHRKGKNMDGHLEDYDKLMRKQFLPYLIAYNHKCIKQRKKSRMYGEPKKNGKGYRKNQDPVSDYLRHTKRRNERLVIFYLGNKDTRKRYYKVLRGKYGLTTEKIRDMENKALVHTAYVWNEKNPYLKVTDFATNTDEKTAHIHTRMAVTGLYGKKRDMATKSEKKKGIHHYIRKPSMSFNKALVKTYPQAINSRGRADNREAMRQMRKRFDPVILASFNKELAKNGINLGLTLSRTGKVNHFDLETYQAHKEAVYAKERAKSDKSMANVTAQSSATLSEATSASYHDLASSIQSAVPSLTGDNGELITSESYLDIAKGTRNIGFNNNKIRLYGTEALSYANKENLEANRESMISSYRSNAESEAQPDIDYKISIGTKDAQSNANESASTSASSSASSYAESVNASLNASNAEWQRSTERSLEGSASESAKAKVKASVKASMATSTTALKSSQSSLAKASADFNESAYGSYYKALKHLPWKSNVTDERIKEYAHFQVTDNKGYTVYPLEDYSFTRVNEAREDDKKVTKAENSYNNWSSKAHDAKDDYNNWSNKATDAQNSYNNWNSKTNKKKSEYNSWARKLRNIKSEIGDYAKSLKKGIGKYFRNMELKAQSYIQKLDFKGQDFYYNFKNGRQFSAHIYKKTHPYKPVFDMRKSKYWNGYAQHYARINNGKMPNYMDDSNLNPLQEYAITQIEDNTTDLRFMPQFNKIERDINNKVGANPNNANNYTKMWYVRGTDKNPYNSPSDEFD